MSVERPSFTPYFQDPELWGMNKEWTAMDSSLRYKMGAKSDKKQKMEKNRKKEAW